MRRLKPLFTRSRMVWKVTYSIGIRNMPIELADDHAGEYRSADRAAAHHRRAMRPHQRHEAENEGDRGHHHGAEPHLRAERGRLADRQSGLALLLRELHDQNAVLGGERDQHHETDLGIEIERKTRDQDAGERTQHADRDR